MTKDEFEEVVANCFTKEIIVLYMGNTYPIAGVDTCEELIGIMDNKDDYEICYKRYENCTLL